MLELDPQQRAAVAVQIVTPSLNDMSGNLKLYISLNTGAVVLLVDLLSASHAPRLVLVPLALSIFAFGWSAVLCLQLLFLLMKPRSMLLEAIATGAPVSELEAKIDAWRKETMEPAKWVQGLFLAGMGFAAIYVVAVIAIR